MRHHLDTWLGQHPGYILFLSLVVLMLALGELLLFLR